jgi:hypothetical protein
MIQTTLNNTDFTLGAMLTQEIFLTLVLVFFGAAAFLNRLVEANSSGNFLVEFIRVMFIVASSVGVTGIAFLFLIS